MSLTMVRVGDLAEQIRGVSFDKGEASDQPGSGRVAVLRAGNITDQGLNPDVDLIFVPEARVSERQKLRPHDVVIAASSGSLAVVGKAAQVVEPIDASFGAFCKVLRPTATVDPRYFGHFFRTSSYRRKASRLAAGANINNLKNEHLDEMLIPLPDPEEQRRIAAVLDQADALRARRRASTELLETLKQSIFLDMFGDPVRNEQGFPTRTLGDMLAAVESGSSPVCLDRPVQGAEWGVLKLGAVTWGEYDDSQNKALPQGVQPAVQLEVQRGDVLFARKNTKNLVGAAAYVYETRPNLLLSDLIFRLRVRDEVLTPLYLQQLLMSPRLRIRVQRLAGGSAGSMPNISKARLRSVAAPVPSIEHQREFARRMEAIELFKRRQREGGAVSQELFASVQHRAFTGAM